MSSSTDPGNRSAAEIEREVERTRAGLTNTLEELRERASPAQLFEQAVDYVRSSGGNDMLRNLGGQVRDNPLPLLLIGAGIGWLMLNGKGGGAGGTAGHASFAGGTRLVGAGNARIRVHGGVEADGAGRGSVAGAADQAIDRAGQAYRGAADAASSAAGSVRDAAGSVADSLRGASQSVAQGVADTGQELRSQAGELGTQAREGAAWLLREQPLVLGALGLALGAAVGALLPGTEAEDRLMGEARDEVADRVQSATGEGYARLKDKAGEHLERAQAAMSQATSGAGEGAGRLGETLADAARETRGALREAAHDLAGEARSALPTGEQQRPKVMPEPQTAPRGGPA
ncbi:DUF3618 domain-containing protein [Paracraurococcus ruber]|uniref:DUF3618 domain-containing protein n=1 Tax=Paracraurococcus ruber TaxID=77675 RepID=A0ABS1D152_9PROT|nr:DUF3618 domain-containing protein [Paracraurococcus ruber]MBK1660507.1 hypothetical protein [Paracraurococcus ruber]TDG27453.1 DUF3618 domain-containing protein [Paracraurococcus ruber]